MRFMKGLMVAGAIVVICDLALVWYAIQTSPALDTTYDLEPR